MSRRAPDVREVRAAAYQLPTPTPEADGTLAWDSTTIVVAEVSADDVVGLGWTYADAACVPLITGVLAPVITGRCVLSVPENWQAMQQRIRNLGRPGLVSCALSAVDIALWDAAARWLDVPAADLLGRCREEAALYGSGGFTSYDDDQLIDQLRSWTDRDIGRVKIKIGESWGGRTDEDLRRVGLTRETVGPNIQVLVDANGGYTVGQARRMADALAELGVIWFEEPVSSDDLAGLDTVRASTVIDVAAGEYGYDLVYFARMAPVVDCLQIDVTRCGGFTEWRRAAAVAAANGLEVSAHCAPNLSAQAAAATPNFRHIEWFADHERIESELFAGCLDPFGGSVTVPRTGAGLGLVFRRDAAEPYAV
ncbi:enolase C-terminal domain-like protein [Microlunatus sp. Gsoil 973]|uniref:enolase C-terminal domain-like protein n=1 Tax=Microlunatus sp. Gsoil 973 TaxID=2672569 RepID=UPI0012B4B4BF|nr:enolase C-terminal domain-like protein [Microlunatus sp. Gsoil 973]QGN32865.1 mandelate racemase [Microlunatus sp. Gsoil 973]